MPLAVVGATFREARFLPRENASRPDELASVFRWRTSVHPGSHVCSFVSRLKTSAKAAAAITMPNATRKRSTPARIRRETRCPPRAMARRTRQAPAVYAIATAKVLKPKFVDAAELVTKAIAGPPHGTNTNPRAQP